jgi:raffinose synthase
MMILDDGWQSTRQMPTGEKRLSSFRVNEKFAQNLAPTVERAKREFGIETFLVWHTIVGYWGGVDGSKLEGYGVIDQTRHFGEGVLAHMPTFNNDWWGSLVGFVPKQHIARFFDEYHEALREQGVDGVKVDSQAVLEALADRQGGRIGVSRAYREALEKSADRHFQGRLLNCMSNAQETFYFSPGSNLLRSSIDFFPTRPESHGQHLYANAQVGVWFGQFMHPDWDMFQSGHEWGAYHAAARAVSGGPVYVSDKPGEHDFALLQKLVTSDGRVLRADRPGLPTRKVLFRDPTREAVALEIWTTNGPAGFVGAFNCHVSGEETSLQEVVASVGPDDVPGLSGERFACFLHQAGRLSVLAPREREEALLVPGEFELFTLVPIERGFAALGLSDKFNSYGAVRSLRFLDEANLEIEVRASGAFVAYSERTPRALRLGSDRLAFEYDAESGRLDAELPVRDTGLLHVQFS